MFRVLICVLVLLAGAWASACSAASAAPLSSGYWIDEQGRTPLEEVAQAHYTPYSGALSLGYVPHPVWLKLRMPAAPLDLPAVLRVRPAFLDTLALYEADAGGRLVNAQHSGRVSPLDANGFQTLDLGFLLPSKGTDHDIYLRLETSTSVLLDCTVLPLADAHRSAQAWLAFIILYIGFLLTLLLWAFLEWLIRRDLIYLVFAIRELASVFYLISLEGLVRYYLSGDFEVSTKDSLYLFGVWMVIPTTLFFEVRLWHELGAPAWARKMARGLEVASFGCLVLWLTGHVREALQFNAAFFCVMVLYSVGMSFVVPIAGRALFETWALWFLRWWYLGVLAFVFLLALTFHGWGMGGFSDFHAAIYFYNAFSSGVFVALLISRARRRDQALQATRMQLGYAEERYVQEQERRQEKEKFLNTLGHELKNPLSVIRLLSSSTPSQGQAVQKAADDMTRLIDRVLQSERLGQEAVTVTPGPVKLGPLFEEVRLRQVEPDRIQVQPFSDVVIESDAILLGSVLSNLFDNALKYSPAKSPVSVSVTVGAQGVGVRVRNAVGDAGSPDAVKVFSKYYRSAQAHRQIGSGLGLFLIAAWMESLGGRVTLMEPEGPGVAPVVFEIWLPR